jgi:hypothetical protein
LLVGVIAHRCSPWSRRSPAARRCR